MITCHMAVWGEETGLQRGLESTGCLTDGRTLLWASDGFLGTQPEPSAVLFGAEVCAGLGALPPGLLRLCVLPVLLRNSAPVGLFRNQFWSRRTAQ